VPLRSPSVLVLLVDVELARGDRAFTPATRRTCNGLRVSSEVPVEAGPC